MPQQHPPADPSTQIKFVCRFRVSQGAFVPFAEEAATVFVTVMFVLFAPCAHGTANVSAMEDLSSSHVSGPSQRMVWTPSDF